MSRFKMQVDYRNGDFREMEIKGGLGHEDGFYLVSVEAPEPTVLRMNKQEVRSIALQEITVH